VEYSFHCQSRAEHSIQNLNPLKVQVLRTQNLTALKYQDRQLKYLSFLCLNEQFYFDGIKSMPSKVEKYMI